MCVSQYLTAKDCLSNQTLYVTLLKAASFAYLLFFFNAQVLYGLWLCLGPEQEVPVR
jgi:hypothetical protein